MVALRLLFSRTKYYKRQKLLCIYQKYQHCECKLTCQTVDVSSFTVDKSRHPGNTTEMSTVQGVCCFVFVSSNKVSINHFHIHLNANIDYWLLKETIWKFFFKYDFWVLVSLFGIGLLDNIFTMFQFSCITKNH